MLLELPNPTTSRKFQCDRCQHVHYVRLGKPLSRICPLCGEPAMAAEDLEKARERVDKTSVPMIMQAIGELRGFARSLHIRGMDITSQQLDLVCDIAAIHLCDSLADPSKADGLARRCTVPPLPWVKGTRNE